MTPKKTIIHLGGLLSYFDENAKEWRRHVPFPEVPVEVLAGLKEGHRQMLAGFWDAFAGFRNIQFPPDEPGA